MLDKHERFPVVQEILGKWLIKGKQTEFIFQISVLHFLDSSLFPNQFRWELIFEIKHKIEIYT